MKRNKWDEPYFITSVCRDDIAVAFEGADDYEIIKTRIGQLTDIDMRTIARKLADDYCNQLFWDSLRIISRDFVRRRK